MKGNPKNILIGALVCVAVILFLGYQFGYKPNAEEAEKIENENKQLEARKVELEQKISNKIIYEEGIANSEKLINSVFKKYGPGNTPEKTIMMIVDLCKKTGVYVNAISFGAEQSIYQNGTGYDGDPVKNTLYKTSTTLSMSSGYTQFKKLFDYINNYPERMNVSEFTVVYNRENMSLATSLSIDLYSVKDENHIYVEPEIENIPIGTENIFGTIPVLEEGEEGIEGEEGSGELVTE